MLVLGSGRSQALDALPQPAGWPAIVAQTSAAEDLGPGVHYQRFDLSTQAGPLSVFLATVDLRDPRVKLAIATHDDVIVGRGERLSSMADRLGAELGINADYFDINESGSPLNLVASGQQVLHAPSRAATFVIDAQGRITMGPASFQAHLAGQGGVALDISAVNEWSPSVDLALITPELGSAAGDGATEMVLHPQSAAGQYQVTRVEPQVSGPLFLAGGELAVAARGAQAQSLQSVFHQGDLVTLSESSVPALDGSGIGIGGGPLLVQGGQPVSDPYAPAPEETNVRNPVTGAGVSADGSTLWLVVVDGRRPAYSIGLTRPQLASLFVALGAQTAMAFDSGGSSEMVVRHEGELQSAAASSPSDGRERSIADGLFVLNAAPQGPLAKLILRAPAAQVLAGSSMPIEVRGVDANAQPQALVVRDVTLHAEPSSLATIDSDGVLHAVASGNVSVSAQLFGVAAGAAVKVVGAVGTLRIVPDSPYVPVGGKLQLTVAAASADGQPIAIDPAVVRWTASGQGRLLVDGTFVAGDRAARTIVRASVPGAQASAAVLSGDHAIAFQAVPQPGGASGQWRYAASPAQLPGAVDASSAPDGAAALRLAYDFSNATGTRAAYAQTEVVLAGRPLALSIDVYGDGNGGWLRGGYRNADGNPQSLTIARHVDWQGWRTIRIELPPQNSWPVTWTRFYLVERGSEAREQGSVWFRNFALIYPGP